MAWILDKCDSHEGEKPGYESIIGFRGTRYSVNSVGKLYITDYNGELTQHTESDKYVLQLRNILKYIKIYQNWSSSAKLNSCCNRLANFSHGLAPRPRYSSAAASLNKH